ncbi:unnamed protein product [Pseudo-nitzschia multistriata]|uniref:Uncharacterized protein n=1 Tax=Pseudo-nitzschia multistriata TaxID=183589 RepID=A0A448YY19_9STRA|nr:unnamed protein product [Pseudo-nitzschia multistriata]
MAISARATLFTLVVAALALSAGAFAPPSSAVTRSAPVFGDIASTSTTQLSERQWNFNEGQSPWGMKGNAETWNGRVAQVAFVWIFLQELVTGKGVFQGIEEGNWFFLLNAGVFGVGVVALTGWLAIQGDDDYTKE